MSTEWEEPGRAQQARRFTCRLIPPLHRHNTVYKSQLVLDSTNTTPTIACSKYQLQFNTNVQAEISVNNLIESYQMKFSNYWMPCIVRNSASSHLNKWSGYIEPSNKG